LPPPPPPEPPYDDGGHEPEDDEDEFETGSNRSGSGAGAQAEGIGDFNARGIGEQPRIGPPDSGDALPPPPAEPETRPRKKKRCKKPDGSGPEPPSRDHELDDFVLPFEFSENNLSYRFSHRFADILVFVHLWNKWMRWERGLWREDHAVRVFDEARKICASEGERALRTLPAKSRPQGRQHHQQSRLRCRHRTARSSPTSRKYAP
jgi:hypothetical protein